MFYEAVCTGCNSKARPLGYGYQATTYEAAGALAAAHEVRSPLRCGGKTLVLAICPNCDQWRWEGDCVNDCASKGLAPKAGPETHDK